MYPASPSRLVIPASSASPSSTTNLQTGRPPLWTNSSQRKMARLYLYTTLQINKILEVVHHPLPLESIPGKDSANKKLNALLDKEPRWLKPKNESDMFRRCEQLERSSMRTTAVPAFARHHSHSAPPLYFQGNTTPIKQERDVQSATLEVPPWSHSPVGYYPSAPYAGQHFAGVHGRSVSDDIGGPSVSTRLMRTTTGMSVSTDHTTGSFHRLLEGYSDGYVRTVKRLIKRYTVPTNDHNMSISPSPSNITIDQSWANDPDAASVFNTRPFPLAGDFLSMDLHLGRQHPCFPESEQHQKRWCMCHAHVEAPHSIWVTPDGLTPLSTHLMTSGLTFNHLALRDEFGNTMLHLLAARGPEQLLLNVVQTDFCASILNDRNTAGQTFLHVLGESWTHNIAALFDLINTLERLVHEQKFDMSARDRYGRTFFHMLFSADIPSPALSGILQQYGGLVRSSRDAFNVKPGADEDQSMDLDQPMAQGSPSQAHDDPSVIRDSQFLQLARLAQENPEMEDEDGRNGLQCLALASLSVKSFMNKASLMPTTLQGRQKKRGKMPEELLDSSEPRLELRLSLTQGLLDAGVDPNNYDSYGHTPLMAFCAELPEDDDYKTGPMIIKLLLARGADINARNRSGETALHIAVRCGRKLAVKTLVEEGANVHARDAAGRSVLAVADAKMRSCNEDVPVGYCHFEACRAHLSGKGFAVQEPTIAQEWGLARE